MNQKNTRNFHKRIYAGQLETIELLKCGDDMQQKVVTSYKLFQCRRSPIVKSGQTLLRDISVGIHTVWHIPRVELDRVGVLWINALDRIVDKKGRFWQAESQQTIWVKLFENWITFQCVRVDPS